MNGNTIYDISFYLALAVHVIILAVGLWDIIVITQGHPENTVSNISTNWAKNNPIFPVAIGIIIGHIFWK